jgi:hypothetical protein
VPDSEKPKRYARDFTFGERLFDHIDLGSGLRALVLRGPFCFCAYVGVQADHTLAGLEEFDFECHWGITWKSWGDDEFLPAGWYWWGWDYGHAGDRMDLPEMPPEFKELFDELDELLASEGIVKRAPKDWTVEEVTQDALDVLVTLREQLAHSAQLAQLALPAPQRPA